ncbi:hypothetical protein [Leifsonia sp. 71-9]|uniref:hypothetical protein n=1 Tax=Leifsonia sp. 71-9 TaxID=1895934 RepID=UPI0025C39B37|nr:hypothetical protein [Leifsonia sp. 71-9]
MANVEKVFVVHGRNAAARDSMFTFLRSLGLKPIEWDQAIALTGKGFARLWPSGKTEPNPFHNINYSNSSQTNLVTVPVGADGSIKLHNVSGDTVHFILDVEGFYSPLVTQISTPTTSQVLGTSTPVIAGTGNAGATITVSAAGSPICTSTVDTVGSWQCIPGAPLADGVTTFSATQSPAAAVAVPRVTVSIKAPTMSIACPAPYTNGGWTDTLPTSPIACTVTVDAHGIAGTELVTTLNEAPTADFTPVSASSGLTTTVNIPNRSGWYKITAGLVTQAGPTPPVQYSFGLNDGTPSDAVASIRKADPTVFANLAATTGGGAIAAQATSQDGTKVVVPTVPTDGISVSTTDQAITNPDTGATTTLPASAAKIGLPVDGGTSNASPETPGVVTYAGANATTTVPVTKDDGRVQIATTIRDASAPHAYIYPLALPAEQSLKLEADGSVSITNTNGDMVGFIPAPWAKDATGGNVPTHFEISGNQLTQIVDFTANTAFPVVADPLITFGYAQGPGLYINLTGGQMKTIAAAVIAVGGASGYFICNGKVKLPPYVAWFARIACAAVGSISFERLTKVIIAMSNNRSYGWFSCYQTRLGGSNKFISTSSKNCS